MKTAYDPEVDALYVSLSDRPSVESEEISPGVVFDFDDDHRLVGIELLNARTRLATDALVAAE
ncbi:DUF2283 domain-containing protein [Roseospira visakhapatnamensis]|uniref:Uncharacterized protein YuzE n=1 Tax=Roseospira visakhapatnamensis TaxID=390880 RepID=A0A7W6RE09_9PROT|nr:DUF2283 domain-containing protein [Roseospira visakhapatnamensis]MBB4266294.1 uncharacterized protein YuzE [Roseospira visakhapatnamensis]